MEFKLKEHIQKYAIGIAALILACGIFQEGKADQIPYTGGYNTATYSFTAVSTGNIVGYFVGGSYASYENQVGLLVNGILTSAGYGLDNHNSSIGDSFNFGHVNAGDTLVFVLKNLTLQDYAYSDPTMNTSYDSNGSIQNNHIYSTTYTTPSSLFPGVPMGTYIGFEDLRLPYSDYNYNDESFVFTNIPNSETAPVPEPISMLLFGTGVVGLAGIARRKKIKR